VASARPAGGGRRSRPRSIAAPSAVVSSTLSSNASAALVASVVSVAPVPTTASAAAFDARATAATKIIALVVARGAAVLVPPIGRATVVARPEPLAARIVLFRRMEPPGAPAPAPASSCSFSCSFVVKWVLGITCHDDNCSLSGGSTRSS
jgi:hypothetical protein